MIDFERYGSILQYVSLAIGDSQRKSNTREEIVKIALQYGKRLGVSKMEVDFVLDCPISLCIPKKDS